MHSEWLWVAGGLWHVPFLWLQPAKWWKQQFGPGVRDIIKEKGCLQLLHLAGNCQLTLTKKGISALAAAFKGSVIRWHYKYRIVHGGGGAGTSGSLTWQFCFSCACLSKARPGLPLNKISSLSDWDSHITCSACNCGRSYFQLLRVVHNFRFRRRETTDKWKLCK